MTFARQRSPGAWTGTISTAEFDAIDDHISKAIDGNAGGSYSPSAAIVIHGAFGLNIDDDSQLVVDGAFVCTSTTIAANFQAAIFQDDVVCNQSLSAASFVGGSINVTTVNASANLHVGAVFDVDGAADFAAHVDFHGTTTFTGAATINTLSVTTSLGFNAASANDLFILNGAGRIQYRIAAATSASATYQPNAVDIVKIPSNNTLTADVIWTIGDTGAQDGMIMHLSRSEDTTAYNVAVKQVGGSTICILQGSAGAQIYPTSCVVVREGGVWNFLHGCRQSWPDPA